VAEPLHRFWKSALDRRSLYLAGRGARGIRHWRQVAAREQSTVQGAGQIGLPLQKRRLGA